MTDESKTDGTAKTETATEQQAGKTATDTATASADQSKGVQARIDGLTAEKNRIKSENDALKEQLAKLEEERKSETEKAMDAYAKEKLEHFRSTEHDPLAQRTTALEAALKSEIDGYKNLVPEDKRPASFDGLDLVPQLEAWRSLASGLGINEKKPPINAGGNDAEKKSGRVWKMSEILEVQNDKKRWEENREDILTAKREGRVIAG